MNNLFDSNSGFAKLMSLIMVFVFIGLGAIFLFVPVMWESFKGRNRIILGIAVILYAIFRAYRVFKMKNEEFEEDDK